MSPRASRILIATLRLQAEVVRMAGTVGEIAAGAADVPVVAGAVADGGGMAAAADMAAATAAMAAAEDGTRNWSSVRIRARKG